MLASPSEQFLHQSPMQQIPKKVAIFRQTATDFRQMKLWVLSLNFAKIRHVQTKPFVGIFGKTNFPRKKCSDRLIFGEGIVASCSLSFATDVSCVTSVPDCVVFEGLHSAASIPPQQQEAIFPQTRMPSLSLTLPPLSFVFSHFPSAFFLFLSLSSLLFSPSRFPLSLLSVFRCRTP